MEFPAAKALQDLSVLVAEIGLGALVQPGEPNYALLIGATRTIQSLLDAFMSGELNHFPESGSTTAEPPPISNLDQWLPWTNTDFWDFETDFWRNLADHPTLDLL